MESHLIKARAPVYGRPDVTARIGSGQEKAALNVEPARLPVIRER